MTYTKLITLLVVAIGMVQTADAGLQWVATGNAPNNVNTGGAGTGEITIGVIPSAGQLASLGATPINTYSVSMGLELLGDISSSTVQVDIVDLLMGGGAGFQPDTIFSGSDPASQSAMNGDVLYYSMINLSSTLTLDTLPVADIATGRVDVLKLEFEFSDPMDILKFTDNSMTFFSQLGIEILPGATPNQTQFQEFGSVDNGEVGMFDPLLDATPTANTNSTNFGVAGDSHVLEVGTAPAVPEPSSFLCLSMIVFATGGARWYRKRQAVAVSEEA